jgi:hypothetical protein
MAIQEVMAGLVRQVSVETAYLPPLVIDDPFAPGPPAPILQALKPKITLTLATGKPLVMAPYGDPGQSRWPALRAVLLVAGLIGVGLMVRGALR